MIFLLIRKYWPYIAFAVIILSIIAYIGLLRHQVQSLTAKNTEISVKLSQSVESINLLKSEIENQNTAIDTFSKAADERLKKAQQELTQAKNTADQYRKEAGTILLKQKKQDETACDAANRIINEKLK